MCGSYDPAEVAHLQRIVELAATDLGIKTEDERSVMAARVVAAADRGERDFDRLMTAAKGVFNASASSGESMTSFAK